MVYKDMIDFQCGFMYHRNQSISMCVLKLVQTFPFILLHSIPTLLPNILDRIELNRASANSIRHIITVFRELNCVCETEAAQIISQWNGFQCEADIQFRQFEHSQNHSCG